ncbi:alkaline phosphatase family protein [Sphingobacterium anhuiense]|uniref:Alkaline phosphatase family protein n=1 Tax=Sphingobacterium anhuiense TaxID=493780 RepID=A0ABW5Z1G8_9SPHI
MKNKILILLGIVLNIGVMSSCKKYDNPPPVFEDIKDFNGLQRKIIVISIDGLAGEELQKAIPTNLATLQKHSKYSYNTLATSSNAAGWVSMLTGTGFSKHKVSADNFERTDEGHDEDHTDPVNFRNVLDYVTQYKSVTTAMVTTWEELRDYTRNADYAPKVNSDLAVKDSTVSLLSRVNSLGTIIVNLRDVQKAGEDGGYTVNNAKFKAAIAKSDEYIGNIVEAIKARKNYEKEDWLIVVTTNHGGSNTDAKNGFTIVSQPNLQEYELKKSGFNPSLFQGTTARATVDQDNGLYDGGTTKDFTVQMDVKFNLTTQWPGFLSKGSDLRGQSMTGWLWLQSGNSWGVVFGGTQNGGSGKTQISSTSNVADGKWHTLTMVVKTTGSPNPTARTVTIYTDGVENSSGSILANRSLTVADALRVGHKYVDNTGNNLSLYTANLSYYNVALEANTIKDAVGLKDITKHPNYASLIGFWPMDEGSEGTYFNKAPGGYNMSLSGDYKWTYLEDDYAPGTEPVPITAKISIPTATSDIAALCLYWMNIEILADFNYDGKPYLNNFELEFLKN